MSLMLPPRARKLALTLHVMASVGWLGAVAVFLALALVGVTHSDAVTVRAAYVAMERATWLVIVPLAVASLLTGVVQGLGTPWGLFRHYWVVAKLLLNVAATALLLLHTQPIGRLAAAAADPSFRPGDVRGLGWQLVGDAAGAILALVIATVLSVYKPWGPIGLRHPGRAGSASRIPASAKAVGVVLAGLLLLILLMHLTGGHRARH
jgi:hypothetical protein